MQWGVRALCESPWANEDLRGRSVPPRARDAIIDGERDPPIAAKVPKPHAVLAVGGEARLLDQAANEVGELGDGRKGREQPAAARHERDPSRGGEVS